MASEKRLVRSQTDKMIGGVCGGIGAYFNIDPTLVRIGFAALVLIGVGSPLLLYLLLWIIMPAADSPRAMLPTAADDTGEKLAADAAVSVLAPAVEAGAEMGEDGTGTVGQPHDAPIAEPVAQH